MFLADLPPDILTLVLGKFLISADLLQFWKCGDSKLNVKLSSSITHIDLKAHNKLPSVYPRLLSKLHKLRSLSISGPPKLVQYPTNFHNEIQNLSGSLETLHLLNRPTIDSLMLNALTRTFPRLTTLFIRPSLYPDDLPFLPPTLTCLGLEELRRVHRNDSEAKKVMQLLPRSLTRLETTVSIFSRSVDTQEFLDDWANAPPHLEYIDTLIFSRNINKPLSWLPKSLTFVGLEPNTINWSFNVALAMPPLLQNLAFSELHIDIKSFEDNGTTWTALLPRHLTHLKFGKVALSRGINYLNSADIASLPRTLKAMHLGTPPDWISWRTDFNAAAWWNLWPPALTTLSLPYYSMESLPLECLPRTLKNLTIEGVKLQKLVINGEVLPPTLTSFHLTHYLPHHEEPLLLFSSPLPSTLADFTLKRKEPALRFI